MNRSRAYYRHHRERVINRKKDICKKIGGDEYVFAWSRGKLGRFSKGKIHCSCRMCRRKSYDEMSHRDRKKDISTVGQMFDCQPIVYNNKKI